MRAMFKAPADWWWSHSKFSGDIITRHWGKPHYPTSDTGWPKILNVLTILEQIVHEDFIHKHVTNSACWIGKLQLPWVWLGEPEKLSHGCPELECFWMGNLGAYGLPPGLDLIRMGWDGPTTTQELASLSLFCSLPPFPIRFTWYYFAWRRFNLNEH